MMKKNEGPKPMKWREAIEFLIRFGEIEDPGKLRPGDRLNLVDDLRRYLEDDGEGQLAGELAQADANPAKLMDAVKIARHIANLAADHGVDEIEVGRTVITFDARRLGDERGAISVDGSLRDAIADDAACDFGDAEPWQICRCLECRRLFLAGRKGQIYCTHSCANAAASRGYRKNNAKKRAQRERVRYQKKKLAGAEGPQEK
jgi:hypothetical protein